MQKDQKSSKTEKTSYNVSKTKERSKGAEERQKLSKVHLIISPRELDMVILDIDEQTSNAKERTKITQTIVRETATPKMQHQILRNPEAVLPDRYY